MPRWLLRAGVALAAACMLAGLGMIAAMLRHGDERAILRAPARARFRRFRE